MLDRLFVEDIDKKSKKVLLKNKTKLLSYLYITFSKKLCS